MVVLPALGELTNANLNQIRLIVNDAIDASEKRLDAKIQASETRMKEHITQQVDSLKTPVAWLIGILVAVIALIGIPFVVLTFRIDWRRIKDNSEEKINQELREEIETLKQQRSDGERFHEMVSDAVGAKVLGQRSEGTLPIDSPEYGII